MGKLDDTLWAEPRVLTWHVAKTKPFSEMIAEASLHSKGFEAFNPKCYSHRVVRGRRTWTERCYIPGYIFIRFDPIEDERWPQINFARGIQSLLYSASEKPAPIRDVVMNVLLDRCDGDRVKAEEIDNVISRIIPVGATVRLQEGPFEGFTGKVVWSEDDRLKAVLSVFGRATKVTLPYKSVTMLA